MSVFIPCTSLVLLLPLSPCAQSLLHHPSMSIHISGFFTFCLNSLSISLTLWLVCVYTLFAECGLARAAQDNSPPPGGLVNDQAYLLQPSYCSLFQIYQLEILKTQSKFRRNTFPTSLFTSAVKFMSFKLVLTNTLGSLFFRVTRSKLNIWPN